MITIKNNYYNKLVILYNIPKVRVTDIIVCCLVWPCYIMKNMSTISTNSAFVEFLIYYTLSNNDGARGASSYFKKLDNSELEFMMQEMRLNNCNGLTVISSLRIVSVGHCRYCCN